MAAVPAGSKFTPLMTLYLTDNTSVDEVYKAKQAGIPAFKLYPAGMDSVREGVRQEVPSEDDEGTGCERELGGVNLLLDATLAVPHNEPTSNQQPATSNQQPANRQPATSQPAPILFQKSRQRVQVRFAA